MRFRKMVANFPAGAGLPSIVDSTMTLGDLHLTIQAAMGWSAKRGE
jgi:hypothetical protein